MLNAVATPRRVSRAQASSPDVYLFDRIKAASFVRDRLPATSKALKTKPYVSSLSEFLKGRAVIQGTRPPVHQMSMDLQKENRCFRPAVLKIIKYYRESKRWTFSIVPVN